jgi:conjugal transfer pilus assembly protein TraV
MSPFDHSPLTTARRAFGVAAGLSLLALAGCASMAGVGGSAEFGCKAPVGVQCDSVSGNYYNALQRNLPSQQKSARPKPEALDEPSITDQPAKKMLAPAAFSNRTAPSVNPTLGTLALTRETSAPLRSPARVLRLWIKPWEDADGDLHSPSYVYVPIDAGHWLIDHAPRPERDAFAPIKPPRSRASAVPDSAGSGDAPRTARDGASVLRPWSAATTPASNSAQGNDDGQ